MFLSKITHPLALILVCLGSSLTAFGFAQETRLASPIDLLTRLSLGGDIVLEAGRFELTETVTITADLNLSGAGKDSTIIVISASPIGIRIKGDIAVTIEGISFEYVGEAAASIMSITDASFDIRESHFSGAVYLESSTDNLAYGSGLYVLGNAKGKITSSEFIANQLDGLSVDKTASVALSSNLFHANATGISVFANAQVTVTDTLFTENGSFDLSGVYAEGNASVSLVGNSFINNKGGAVIILDNASLNANLNLFEANGNFEEGYATISLENNVLATLHENRFIDNHSSAVIAFNHATVEFSNNHVENTGGGYWSAVSATHQSQISVTGNTFLNNPNVAFQLTASASGEAINNTFDTNGEYENGIAAIIIEDNATATLSDNLIQNSLGGALSIFANSSVKLSNNQIIATKTWATIYLRNNSSLDATANHISQSEGVGIYAKDRVELTLLGNTFSSNTDFGVQLVGQAKATVTANTFEANRSGLVLFEQAYASVLENSFTNNLESGISFMDASTGHVRNNQLSNNKMNGIAVLNNASPQIENNVFENNLLRGILYGDDAKGNVIANTIRGSNYGIFVADQATPSLEANIFEVNTHDTGTGALPEDEQLELSLGLILLSIGAFWAYSCFKETVRTLMAYRALTKINHYIDTDSSQLSFNAVTLWQRPLV